MLHGNTKPSTTVHCSFASPARLAAVGALALLACSGPALARGRCCSLNGYCLFTDAFTCRQVGGIYTNNADCNPTPAIACGNASAYVGPIVPIPDGVGIGAPGPAATASLAVPGIGTVANVYVSIFIQHPRQGDLQVVLRHLNSGKSAVLVFRPGTSASPPFGFTAPNLGVPPSPTAPSMLFSDSASVRYDSPSIPSSGMPNATGAFLPMSPLSVFRGDPTGGMWTLEVTDWASGAAGSIVSFALGFDRCVADMDNGSGTGIPDGGVGIEDLLYYLSQYNAGSPRADVDDGSGTGHPDGGVGIEDLLYYLTRYNAGC